MIAEDIVIRPVNEDGARVSSKTSTTEQLSAVLGHWKTGKGDLLMMNMAKWYIALASELQSVYERDAEKETCLEICWRSKQARVEHLMIVRGGGLLPRPEASSELSVVKAVGGPVESAP